MRYNSIIAQYTLARAGKASLAIDSSFFVFGFVLEKRAQRRATTYIERFSGYKLSEGFIYE